MGTTEVDKTRVRVYLANVTHLADHLYRISISTDADLILLIGRDLYRCRLEIELLYGWTGLYSDVAVGFTNTGRNTLSFCIREYKFI